MTPALRAFGRAFPVFAVLLAVAVLWPRPWMTLIARVSAPIIDAVTPWAQSISIDMVDRIFVVSGAIVFDGVLSDGRPMPPIPGTWRQSALVYLSMLPVALTAWAIPAVPWRRRGLALPLALGLALLLAALSLTVEIQRAALESVGSGALVNITLADIPRNHDLLASLERRLSVLRWTCEFLAAGGRLGLALLAGFASVLIMPQSRRTGDA